TYSGATLIVSGATISAGTGGVISGVNSPLTLSGSYPLAAAGSTLISNGTNTATLNLSGVPDATGSDTTLLVNEPTTTSPDAVTNSVDPLALGIQAGTISGDPSLLTTTSGVVVSGNDPMPLTLTPTPEPGSGLLLAFGTSMIIGWRRRRRA
ncbi:MAG TPA: PEP-CTERM sorting domain-containing protein, partial [Chthoniobacter sp.]|nr:PEP-CTERM sorting domain-containing protein [Chthoniobacter sp.]